jgi:hypothetical protein
LFSKIAAAITLTPDATPAAISYDMIRFADTSLRCADIDVFSDKRLAFIIFDITPAIIAGWPLAITIVIRCRCITHTLSCAIFAMTLPR